MRTALFAPVLAFLVAFSSQAADWLYLTVPGDTLSGIGQTYLRNPKDWPKVQSVNGVPIPKHLPANSRLKIPVELLKVTPAPVSVIAVKGNVRFKRADGPYEQIKAGEVLNGGETVLTSFAASVSYRFADNTRLTQQASSKLSFGRLASYGKTGMVSTEISLDSGRLEASAAKQLAPAGGFRVRTPVAVAGLRGTGFRLNVDEDGKTLRNEVTEGAVAVSAQGVEVQVDAGFGTYAEQGKAPAAPVKLLAKPDLSGLPDNILRLPPSLNWPADSAARAWRAQLSDDADFHTVLYDDVFNRPGAQWPDDLPDGQYFLRVRAIDSLGLEGLDAQHAFTLNARPIPPTPLKPALGERLALPDVELAWNAAAGAQGYRLQLAPTPEFGQGLIERTLPPVETTRETLSAGDWHWRIASLDSQGRPRAFSPHRAFRVQPPPAIPTLLPQADAARMDHADTSLNWQPSEGALAYRVQVAALPDFAQPVIDQRVADTRLAVRTPAPGDWHWRVAALGVDDSTQGYSPSARWHYQPPPAIPTLLPQADAARMAHADTSLNWQPSEGALAYHVQVAALPDFARPLIDQRVTDTPLAVRAPAPGVWHWRVAALGVDDITQGYSPSARWHYQPPPAPPESLQVREEGGLLVASWQGASAAYRLELSSDDAFRQLISSHIVQHTEARLLKPAPGQYWLRVIALDGDKFDSAPSAAASVVIQHYKPWWLLPLLFFLP